MTINFSSNLNINSTTFGKKPKAETKNAQKPTVTPETEKEKQSKHLGVKIATAALATGFGALAVLKGIPLISKGKVNDFILKLENKSRKLSVKNNLSSFEKVTSKVVNKTKGAMNSYKIALNFTSVKDAGFKKITDKIPFVGAGFRKITEISEKIAMHMVEKKYVKTNKQFNKLYKAFYDANTSFKEGSSQKYENLVSNLRNNMSKHFSNSEVEFRLNEIKKSFDGIDAKVYEETFGKKMKIFGSKETYVNCLAEQISMSNKNKYFNNINNIRASITNTRKNDINVLKQYVTNINSLLDPLADDTITAMRKIEVSLKKIAKNDSEEVRKTLLEDIKSLNNLVPDEKLKKELAKTIDNFKFSKTGEIQEILAQYKDVLSSKEYAKLEKAANKAIKSLDKSTNIEANKFFEKIRDLEIGSAPTDVVSIATSIGAVGYGLSRADSKDERISAALNYGIPAIGAVTVSSICTLSLVAAGPSLAIGLVSGLVINKIGSLADKIRKALNTENQKADVVEK